MRDRLLNAMAEHHSGNAAEANLILDAIMDEMLKPTEGVLAAGANALNCSTSVKTNMGMMYDAAASMHSAMILAIKEGS